MKLSKVGFTLNLVLTGHLLFLPGNVEAVFGFSGPTTRVSIADSSGAEADGNSSDSDVSSDGRYVVFASRASNLVAGDTNGLQDVFLHDRNTGLTERISVDSNENQANAESFAPVVSDDGRYVAFHSLSNTLVASDTNMRADVFLRDRTAGTTIRVSVDSSGTQGDGESVYPSISDDGNLIAFVSHATNLVANDTNAKADVFVYNHTTAATTRVSVDSSSAQADDESLEVQISGNGLFVVFSSRATNLTASDTNDCMDIFVRDISGATTELVSVHTNGTIGNLASSEPRINTNGSLIVFSSRAGNLVDTDANGYRDVFLHNRTTDETKMVSLADNDDQLNLESTEPDLSIAGRFVTFSTRASNPLAGDTNGAQDVYMRDTVTDSTILLSSDSSGVLGNASSAGARISQNGGVIVFSSEADNLIVLDANSAWDVFVKENNLSHVFVGVTAAVSQVAESGSATVDFTFTRSDNFGQELTVKTSWSRSSATAGEDYDLPVTPTEVFFGSGEEQKVVTITVHDDSIVEGAESIVASIVNDEAYTILPGEASASVDIIDNGETYEVSLSTKMQVIREVGESRLTFTDVIFERKEGMAGDTVVNFTVTGTATSGVDYEALPTQVTIPDGQDSVSLRVQALDDEDSEEYELIKITINPDAGYTLGDDSDLILAIKDNEQWSPPFEWVQHLFNL